jgi:uncharacterized integral membrane protein (TIGR00697 family)
MNELLFILHVAVVCGTILLALRHSYGGMVSVISLQLVTANLFVLKQVTLFGMTATGSEIFTVSTMYGMGLIQECYGARRAQHAVYYGFLLLLFFVGTATLHGWYALMAQTPQSEAFGALFGHTPRLVVASLVAYLVSEQINLRLMHLAQRSGPVSLVWRAGAVWAGQWADTILFGVIGLYGVMPRLFEVILFCMAVKTVAIIALAPMIMFAKRYICVGEI